MSSSAHSAPSRHSEQGFPWSHVIGYIISLILTIAALWIVVGTKLSGSAMVAYILIFAGLQILVQLFFFMHFTESVGPRYHIMALVLGLFFALVIVLGTIWVMAFGVHQSY